MANILEMYLSIINNSPESKISHLEGEIRDHKIFINMYEKDIKLSQDLDKIKEFQDNINFCQMEIIKIKELIQSIRDGNTDISIGVQNVETNMF